MKILGYFCNYGAASQYAKDNGHQNVSIQNYGQGYQMHRWTLIDLGAN